MNKKDKLNISGNYTALIIIGLIIMVFYAFSIINTNSKSGLYTIDLTNIPNKENTVELSQFASEITYIPLESNANSLIGPGVRFYLFDSIVVSCAHHQILIFDSGDGKFIRSIGEYGNSPMGFANSRTPYLKNGEIIIEAFGWDYYLIEFSANGEILNRLKFDLHPGNIAWLTDDLYAVYYDKHSDSDSLRIVIYDSAENEDISFFYDRRIFKNKLRKRTHFGAFFYHYSDKLFIKEYFNDTVFQVTTNKLIPHVLFKSGEYSPPFFEKDKFDYTQYHNIQGIIETENQLFFQFYFKKRGYYCYFDKRTNQLNIPNYKELQINGFENDIDGFMPFYPISISNRNELIGFLEPYKIKQWFNENPDKAEVLPPYLRKFRNINENDNPVLMLVKLKE